MEHNKDRVMPNIGKRPGSLRRIPLLALAVFALLGANAQAKGGYCTQTADSLLAACRASISDDTYVGRAICINVSDSGDRAECFGDLQDERKEAMELCADQHDWRLDACKLTGEGRYDPDFDPANFDADFTHLTNPNLYFPLAIGNHWDYLVGGEVNTVEVMNHTKSIDGVTCVVVRDEVFQGNDLSEGTNDWYAQAVDGDVWYCGEETATFETFDGDHPKIPELVSIDGSFKAGRDGDKPGIIFLKSPKKGDVYFEEFSLANAEDVTVILSTHYSYGKKAELDELVPKDLAGRFCNGDCVVTKNFSLLEPGVFARKYYAPGIGVFLEVEPDSQEVDRLVNCNFDPRCLGLPTP